MKYFRHKESRALLARCLLESWFPDFKTWKSGIVRLTCLCPGVSLSLLVISCPEPKSNPGTFRMFSWSSGEEVRLTCERFRSNQLHVHVLISSTQALEYLLKFIIQSRILYSRATCGMEEEQFRASIQELFLSIRFVLSLDSRGSETLVFTQVSDLNTPRRSKHSDTQQGLGDLHWLTPPPV